MLSIKKAQDDAKSLRSSKTLLTIGCITFGVTTVGLGVLVLGYVKGWWP
jgi:hypothetical protein